MTKKHELETALYHGLRTAGPVGDEVVRDMGYDTPQTVYESIAGATVLRAAMDKLSTPHVPSAESDDNHGWPTADEARVGRAALSEIRHNLQGE